MGVFGGAVDFFSADDFLFPKQLLMWAVGGFLMWLAIKKNYEPALLLPMGFGAILVNLPLSGVLDTVRVSVDGRVLEIRGVISWLYDVGIDASEALPLVLFIGIGAMVDFGPLLCAPKMFLYGAAAQAGIFMAMFAALFLGFSDINDAAAIGMIGAADGPTAILVSNVLNSQYKGAITVAAYSYMAMVPLILPVAVKSVTTRKERLIRMEYKPAKVSKTTKILFPVIVTVIAGIVAPMSVALVGFLMFGNLIRECGRLESLSKTAQNELANLVTILLGISVSFNMRAAQFIRWETLVIMALGLAAFFFDAVFGVLFVKFLNLFTKTKANPMVGAAGISAFPMASRVVQKLGIAEDKQNFLLMQAAGANVAGQIASVVAGGMILSILAK